MIVSQWRDVVGCPMEVFGRVLSITLSGLYCRNSSSGESSVFCVCLQFCLLSRLVLLFSVFRFSHPLLIFRGDLELASFDFRSRRDREKFSFTFCQSSSSSEENREIHSSERNQERSFCAYWCSIVFTCSWILMLCQKRSERWRTILQQILDLELWQKYIARYDFLFSCGHATL